MIRSFLPSRFWLEMYQMECYLFQIPHDSNRSRKEIIECVECGITFKRRSNLNSHIRTIHNQQYPHICSICGKGVNCKQILRGHMADKHGFEKDYKCQFCNQEFAYKQPYMMHLQKQHSFIMPCNSKLAR